MTAGVRVTLGGRVIASGWDGSDLVAVSGLKIRWGREDAYDDPDPSLLTLKLIDRKGTFVADPERIGQAVTVEMVSPARVMFRGTITKPRAERRSVHNPLLNADETVWLVTVTASDPLANLGMAVYAGSAVDGWKEGAGGWPEVRVNARLAELFAAGASGVVSGFESIPDTFGSPTIGRRLTGQNAEDARTALELLQQAYRGEPLGVVNYDPATDMVKVGRFAPQAPVALTLTAGLITLTMPTGYVVPASSVGVSDYELESRVDAAIDVVQVGYWWYGKDPTLQPGTTNAKRVTWIKGFIEGRTARYNPRTRRVLKIDTEYMTFDPSEYVAGSVDMFNRFPAWLRDSVLAIVNKLNGQLRAPSLIFDAERMPLPAALEAVIYQPTLQAVPLYFTGSVFNGMTAVGPQFQIIGGTLTYADGWRHDVTVCSTGAAAAAAGVTLGQLVTNPTPTLADFDPDISLADLGLITTGLL